MKKIIFVILTILTVLILSAGVMASGNVVKFKGYPVINLIINGLKISGSDVPPISIDGKKLIPLNASVEKIDGIVNWNEKTKTATILKPETSIFFILLNDDGKTLKDVDSSMPIVDEGKAFYSEVDVSGIPKGIYTIKSKIVDSSGSVISESEEVKYTIKEDNDMFEQYFEWNGFQILPGVYKYKVEMKDSSGAFKTIATKTMKYSAAN